MTLEIAPPKRDGPRSSRHSRGLNVLLRLCGWGGAAAAALAAVAVTLQTGTGSARLREAYASLSSSTMAVAAMPPRDAETRALEAQVRALTADRDRLVARMASLERHLDDMTGSIPRQAVPMPQAAPAAAPPAVSAAPEAFVKVAAVAAATPKFDPLARPVLGDIATGWPDTAAKEEPQAEPEDPAEPQMAVPLPPPRFIAAPIEPPSMPKVEFGIELGTAADMDKLRARWTTVKATYGPLLTGMQPIAVRERRPGGMEFRLIAGPVPNLAVARQLCARFIDARAACRPATFNAENVVQR